MKKHYQEISRKRPIYKVRFCRMRPPYDTLTTLFRPRFLKHVLKSYTFCVYCFFEACRHYAIVSMLSK